VGPARQALPGRATLWPERVSGMFHFKTREGAREDNQAPIWFWWAVRDPRYENNRKDKKGENILYENVAKRTINSAIFTQNSKSLK
jgi:hypothetical protein